MAIRLAAKGYSVDVFEKNEGPGGKLTEFTANGYRFDAGPSLFTMPELVIELFELMGEDPQNSFKYDRLDEICNYFFDDGIQYSTYADINKTAESMSSATGEEKENILQFLAHSKKMYDLTADFFIFSSLNDYRKYFGWNALQKLFQIRHLKMNQTMHDSLKAYFKTNHVIEHFSRYATYNGSDPYRAPATLNVIPNLEYYLGAYLPQKGMFDITKSLVALGERNGVKYHYNSRVDKIIHDGKRVIGLQIGQEKLNYDLVVSNIDIHYVYHQLLTDLKKPRKILETERSSSVLVFNWGIKHQFAELGLHNIFFSKDYRQEFQSLFVEKDISLDPTTYIFISSKNIPTDAPPGCENWFTLVNAPANTSQDWDEIITRTRNNIIQKLSRILNQNIEPLIESETILSPPLIESSTGSFQGALYGSSSNSKWSAFLRHSNKSSQLKNLYFIGGSVHPGGGIPLSLSSAKIVDKWI
jgi:phytoene desaturase